MKYEHSTISGFIKTHRTASKLTQKDVGKYLGYTPQFVMNWERGISRPPPKCIKKIAKLFNQSPYEVFDLYLMDVCNELTRKAKL